jgi:hypothetical protein
MRLHIDFSIFTPSESVGNVHGNLELSMVPRSGEVVAFSKPREGVLLPQIDGFSPHLKVKTVVHVPASTADAVLLELEDITVSSVNDAKKVMKYMEEGFGLYADQHDEA